MNLILSGRALLCALLLLSVIIVALPPGVVRASPAKRATAGQCTQTTASGLGYSVLKAGTGAMPDAADKVGVKYKGTLAADGAMFDESDRADFGVSDVIPGFAEGLKLLKTGGRIRLCIPAALGYGASGAGMIPANADLVFDVELLEIKARAGPLAMADRQCATKNVSGLGYSIVKAGSGGMPGDSDIALVNYKGYLGATGAPFDDAGPIPIPVGRIIPGFAEGLKLMQRGGSYKLCIPPALGYGAKGVGPIPANSALVFLIDLIDFKSLAEVQAMQSQSQP